MAIFSSFSEIQKLKIHIFKMFWDTIRCTEKHMDISEEAIEDMGNMERYRDITEGVKDIMGNNERDWGHDRFCRPNYEKDRHVVGHHQRVRGQVGVPSGVQGHH
jgi:hypothetical protein